MRLSTDQRTWLLRGVAALLPLLGTGLLIGCNPAALTMLCMPFMDNKEPPKYKMAAPNKDVTVAIVTWFGNRDLKLWPDVMPADIELSDRLAKYLQDRYALNKDKVKIIPGVQVRAVQGKVT